MAQQIFTTGQTGPQADPSNQNAFPEDAMSLPWAFANPAATFLDYRAWLEVLLDAGMVLHKPLPQEAYDPDTIGVIDMQSPVGDVYKGPGVNINPGLPVSDVIQRMATSTYYFALKGWGLRAGFQVPVPTLRSVGGSEAVPDGVQWSSGQILVGNSSGIPIFFCAWELHYIVAGPISSGSPGTGGSGTSGLPIPYNPALHIRPDAQLPAAIQLPRTQTDQNAVVSAAQPVQRQAPNPFNFL